MEEIDGSSTARKGDTGWLVVAIAFGYGCYLALFPLGPLGTLSMASHVSGTAGTVAIRAVAFACVALGMLACRGDGLGAALHRGRWLCVSYALLAASMAVLWVAGSLTTLPFWAAALWAVVYGVSLGPLELEWYSALSFLWERTGARRCFGAACLCMGVAGCSPLLYPLGGLNPLAMAGVCVSVALASGVCMECARRLARRCGAFGAERAARTIRARCRPALRFSKERFANGIAWTIGALLLVQLGLYRGILDAGVLVACVGGVLAAAVLGVLSAWRDFYERLAYGTVLRWSVALLGMVFTVVPLCVAGAPEIAALLCFVTYQVQNIFNVTNTVSFCRARRLRATDAVPPYYAVYALSVVTASAVACALYAVSDEGFAARILSAIAAASMFLLVPTLPARTSSVEVMSFEKLPEDEDAEGRKERAVRDVAQACSLTARESEVMRLVVRGCSREEIAGEFGISASTVKNHITSLYAKTGVHSARELAALVERKGLGR